MEKSMKVLIKSDHDAFCINLCSYVISDFYVSALDLKCIFLDKISQYNILITHF